MEDNKKTKNSKYLFGIIFLVIILLIFFIIGLAEKDFEAEEAHKEKNVKEENKAVVNENKYQNATAQQEKTTWAHLLFPTAIFVGVGIILLSRFIRIFRSRGEY